MAIAAATLAGCAAGESGTRQRAAEEQPMKTPSATVHTATAGVRETDGQAVLAMLDRFHLAASKADGEAYFALFAPEGVFIGTDAEERWTVEAFKAYAEPYFSKGKGWTYVPRAGRRNVGLSPDGSVAWFDEILYHAKYGVCRGTGAARLVDGRWRVTQYHLTIPVPNQLAERVVGMIKADGGTGK
jgi:uncharacterized protein (TIGR02246 family)